MYKIFCLIAFFIALPLDNRAALAEPCVQNVTLSQESGIPAREILYFQSDINADAVSDYFLADKALCGNGGCMWNIYASCKAGGYTKVADKMGLHPRAILIKKSTHDGLADIDSYWHMSAYDGSLAHHVFDGKKYGTKSSKLIPSSQANIMPWQVFEPLSTSDNPFAFTLHP
ncbi:MAG: hypothetical protein SFT92_05185 [Rickettsiales bacterium]|nr:hypothetical protein [Rickettsiales bacterium]